MQTQTKSIQKQIAFSPQLYSLLLSRARRFGLTFTDFIRVVLVNEVKEETDDLPMVDKETEKMIGKSLKAYKEGRYTTITTKKELTDYLNNLKQQI